MSDEPMVRVRGLSRTYDTGAGPRHAVQEVSFDVARGSLVALVGRSGSGKTTLLGCLGALDAPSAGSVEVDGVQLAGLGERQRTRFRRERVAFVFQTFGLLPALSAAENVGLPLRLQRTPVAERERRTAELLELVGLGDRARLRPAELSGGQQQRVAIARALAARPRLLIADEPTGQLDAATGASVLDLLREVVRAEGTTAIVSTHDPRVAAAADRVLHLADGRLVEPAD